MSKVTSIHLPRFSFGEEAFNAFRSEMRPYGKRVAIIYGETAWKSAEKYVLPALKKAEFTISDQLCYGKEATIENAEQIQKAVKKQTADMLLAVGGGKCIDTVKLAADRMKMPVFTIPSIASNCAPVTKLSVMYHTDGSFREGIELHTAPVHCFINPRIILAAPLKYLWAGIGDSMAKHVESAWSAKAGEALSFGSEFGITAGKQCFYPLLRDAEAAMNDAKLGVVTEVLEKTILNIVIAPGITSVSVHPDYNGGVAHALFYGLIKREVIEKNHLHGEIVSYGTLVSLMLDKDFHALELVYKLHKAVHLPVCLADLELNTDDPLEDVLEATMEKQDLAHTPYPVTKEMIHQAILDLESFHKKSS